MRVAVAVLGALLIPSLALAQDAGAPTTMNSVVSECGAVAADHSLSDPTKGPCVSAARSYLAALPPSGGFVQDITDLVVAIAPMSQDEICDIFDEEMAAAVRSAATTTTDPDQAEQLNAIALTLIEDCDVVQTAAIGEPPDLAQGEEVSRQQ